MRMVLVSSCLLGDPVRYDGSGARATHPVLARWRREGRTVPHCPEVAAGLPTPRPPVELLGGDGPAVLEGRATAIEAGGLDRTQAFLDGAYAMLAICRRMDIRVAVLKDRSPTCGSSLVHDGSFSGRTRPGEGIAVALLRAQGIRVFSEHQWDEAQACLTALGPD